ncbi:ThuA domain-containing protein [Neobacillus niacini]|uniref:ThuA domain-containing protein n=1 Tax=Neobacillus niacini TaxID=86668 RepID=UPI001C8D55A9|nr:ThuA domain-containing protein [Neobacillus niacini]MBY0148910.1 ThuA domain-containing protein [Neobacillus niacini]
MIKIAALVGDYWHNGDDAKAGLEAAINRLPYKGETEVQYVTYAEVSQALDEQPDLFINAKMNVLNPREKQLVSWLTEELDEKIVSYVNAGGSLLAWHAGMAGYPKETQYTQMLCGAFDFHPPGLQEVTYINDEVTFTLQDEHYFVHCDVENTEVNLRSTGVDGDSIACWKHSFGKGKVCCFTPAHTKEGMLNENISSLLAEKINWLLRSIS